MQGLPVWLYGEDLGRNENKKLVMRKSTETVYDGGADFYFPKKATPVYLIPCALVIT